MNTDGKHHTCAVGLLALLALILLTGRDLAAQTVEPPRSSAESAAVNSDNHPLRTAAEIPRLPVVARPAAPPVRRVAVPLPSRDLALQHIDLKHKTCVWPERLAERYPAEIQDVNDAVETWCAGHQGVGSHACYTLRCRVAKLRKRLVEDLRGEGPFTVQEHIHFSRLLRGLAELAAHNPEQLHVAVPRSPSLVEPPRQ